MRAFACSWCQAMGPELRDFAEPVLAIEQASEPSGSVHELLSAGRAQLLTKPSAHWKGDVRL